MGNYWTQTEKTMTKVDVWDVKDKTPVKQIDVPHNATQAQWDNAFATLSPAEQNRYMRFAQTAQRIYQIIVAYERRINAEAYAKAY